MNDVDAQWKKFLTPEILKNNLISASIFITGFEILKNLIIERVEEAYTEFFEDKAQPGVKYKKDVLESNKSILYASLEWLREAQVISPDELKNFENIKNIRNSVVHEFPNILTNGLPFDFLKCFEDILYLINVIEKWWVINFEIPVNPDFDDREITVDEIIPGSILSLRILLDVALGSEQEAKQYLDALNKNSDIQT